MWQMDRSEKTEAMSKELRHHALTTDCSGVHIDHLVDHLHALLSQESSIGYRSKDYLKVIPLTTSSGGGCKSSNHKKRKRNELQVPFTFWEMNARDRWQIAQWFYSIIADFKFPEEFAMVAMDYIDRYLSRCDQLPSTKEQVELLALSCFYLAVKLFQAGPVLSTHQMSVLSGRFYTAKQISWTEQRILFTLNWKVHPPCPSDYVRPFVLLLMSNDVLDAFEPANYDMLDVANSLLHSAVLDYYFVAHGLLPSQIAAAAILNAVQIVQSSLPWHPDAMEIRQVLTDYAQLNWDQVEQCQDRLRYISEPSRSASSSQPHQQEHNSASMLGSKNSFDSNGTQPGLGKQEPPLANSPNSVMRVVHTVHDAAEADFEPPYE